MEWKAVTAKFFGETGQYQGHRLRAAIRVSWPTYNENKSCVVSCAICNDNYNNLLHKIGHIIVREINGPVVRTQFC